MSLFRRYECGCIGIPIEEDVKGDGKIDSVLTFSFCDSDRDEPPYGCSVRDVFRPSQPASDEVMTRLISGLVADGISLRSIRGLLKP